MNSSPDGESMSEYLGRLLEESGGDMSYVYERGGMFVGYELARYSGCPEGHLGELLELGLSGEDLGMLAAVASNPGLPEGWFERIPLEDSIVAERMIGNPACPSEVCEKIWLKWGDSLVSEEVFESNCPDWIKVAVRVGSM